MQAGCQQWNRVKHEAARTKHDEDAVLGRVHMRRLDVDLARVRAGVSQHQAPNDEHVGGLVAGLAPLHVVLLVAIHDLVHRVVDLNAVVARQHTVTVLVDPLNLYMHSQYCTARHALTYQPRTLSPPNMKVV